jgi:ribosomal protein S12 methylthiotransferase accessory factor YcaO
MRPEDFQLAAERLAQGAGPVAVSGFPGGIGAELLAPVRLAAGCDRVFLARPPTAPGAVICGARHVTRDGRVRSAAGIGASARDAFVRAMAEVAENHALARRDASGDAVIPRLGADLMPEGTTVCATLAGVGSGLAAAADTAQAARAAWHEAVERHAIALWFEDGLPAPAFSVPPGVLALEATLRRGVMRAPLRYLRLPGAPPGLSVVMALCEDEAGLLAGYGCAADPVAAACKASCEVVMAEFGLHLEQRALAEDGVPLPPAGHHARAAMLATRAELRTPSVGTPSEGPARQPAFAVLSGPADPLVVVQVLPCGLRQPMPQGQGRSPGPV